MNSLFLSTILLISVVTLNAEFNKLQWKDLGSPEIEFLNIDVTPMPLLNPGNITINFRGYIKRPLKGNIKTNLKIIRTISGITLPIRWYFFLPKHKLKEIFKEFVKKMFLIDVEK